jgi:hypothetical protein
MEITDITLIAMSVCLVVGSSAVIIITNCRKCKREPPTQPVETVVSWH